MDNTNPDSTHPPAARDFPVELQRQVEVAILNKTLPISAVLSLVDTTKRFGASLQDMEQVLRSQLRKGLVERYAGGYRVLGLAEPRLDSLFQHTSRAGLKPASQVRAAIIETASPLAATKLDLPEAALVYHQDRTRLVNGEVLANQTNFIPYEICPGLENDDISRSSFQALLEEKYHTIITEIKESMQIIAGEPKDLEILSLPAGAPVLLIERISYSCTHSPVVWASIHIRTDRFHYVSTLWPNAAPLLEQHGLTT